MTESLARPHCGRLTIDMSDDPHKPGAMTRLLAVVCSCCPFCITRRQWPESAYGRFMRHIERACPFCRAYDRLHPADPGEA